MNFIQMYSSISLALLILMLITGIVIWVKASVKTKLTYWNIVSDVCGVVLIPFFVDLLNKGNNKNALFIAALLIIIFIFVWAEMAPFFIKKDMHRDDRDIMNKKDITSYSHERKIIKERTGFIKHRNEYHEKTYYNLKDNSKCQDQDS